MPRLQQHPGSRRGLLCPIPWPSARRSHRRRPMTHCHSGFDALLLPSCRVSWWGTCQLEKNWKKRKQRYSSRCSRLMILFAKLFPRVLCGSCTCYMRSAITRLVQIRKICVRSACSPFWAAPIRFGTIPTGILEDSSMGIPTVATPGSQSS